MVPQNSHVRSLEHGSVLSEFPLETRILERRVRIQTRGREPSPAEGHWVFITASAGQTK